jgi:hypothetical protein
MTWAETKDSKFDLLVAVCGYESRATYVPQAVSENVASIVILDYESEGVLTYDSNRQTFGEMQEIEFLPLSHARYMQSFEAKLLSLMANIEVDAKFRVLFDITCASRKLMSKILLSLDRTIQNNLDLCCSYAVSEFYDPPLDELPSHISEPVVGELSGWSNDLSQPPCAVIGLGFEPGRALGCLDYLEIPEVRLFQPFGPDAKFIGAVKQANNQLIYEAGESNVLPYSVMNPVDTYLKLESMVFGLLAEFRPVLIPLGPKIFAVCCIVLAIRNSPSVCVWRTSSGQLGIPHDTKTDGHVSVFSVGALRGVRTT